MRKVFLFLCALLLVEVASAVYCSPAGADSQSAPFFLASTTVFGFSPGAAGTEADIAFSRASAGVLALGNGMLGDASGALELGSMRIGGATGAVPTWVNTYLPGADSPGAVSSYVVSPGGHWANLAASRASDFTTGVNGSVIAALCLAVNDNTVYADNTWCDYNEGIVSAANFYQHINVENSVKNATGADAAAVDPYTPNPLHSIYNLRLDSGVGATGVKDLSAALDILANGGMYRSGAIIIHAGAMDAAYADAHVAGFETSYRALQMPSDYGIQWFTAAATPGAVMYGDTAGNITAVSPGNGQFSYENAGLYQWWSNNVSDTVDGLMFGSDNSGYTRFNPAQGMEIDTGGNPGVARLKIANTGQISTFNPVADLAVTVQTTGSSLAVAATSDRVILDGVTSPFTLTMPPSAIDGQVFLIECGASIASLTVSPSAGQTVKGTTASCSADQGHSFHYRGSNSTWYKDY